jgi:hypothetical protein
VSKRHLLLILLTVLFALAVSARDTVIILQEYGRRGETGTRESFISGKNGLMINAQKLSPAEVITQSQHIKKISHFKKSAQGADSSCDSGRFEHILKQDNLLKKESGCLGSERFKELKASFQALAKDPLK